MTEQGRWLEGNDGMADRKRRGWNKYIVDYDKLRMFLRYISYGCYHKQYLTQTYAIKMRVASLESVQCLDAPIPAGAEEAFQQFLTSRRQSVTLRIERQNNAVERCFMMFASYDSSLQLLRHNKIT